jgi:ferredoxin-NADP reductase
VAASEVYVCGPEEWTHAAHAAALSAGVDRRRLHTEQFSW